MIKVWLDNKSHRERRGIFVGGILLVTMILYIFLYRPIVNHIDALQEQAQSEVSLLTWMEAAKSRILPLRAAGYSLGFVNSDMLLTRVENALAQRNLNRYLEQVHQPNPGEVELQLHQVPFDLLTDWLETLTHRSGAVVKSVKVTRGDIGLVDANITLTP